VAEQRGCGAEQASEGWAAAEAHGDVDCAGSECHIVRPSVAGSVRQTERGQSARNPILEGKAASAGTDARNRTGEAKADGIPIACDGTGPGPAIPYLGDEELAVGSEDEAARVVEATCDDSDPCRLRCRSTYQHEGCDKHP